jgi:hypothetical protein
MKHIILFLTFLISSNVIFSQGDSIRKGKKPTIIIKPSSLWLNKNKYLSLVDNQGVTVSLPDYNKAFIDNLDLKLVIAAINNLYTERSYPLKSLEQILKNIQNEESEILSITSKSGSEIEENLIDKIRRSANADIELDLTWELSQIGPQKSVTLIIEAIDSYTGKSIASVTGIGKPSYSADVQNLLKESILSNIDNFNAQLQKYFDDVIQNGRETVLKVSVFKDSGYDIETMIKSSELSFEGEIGELVEKWLDKNTINSQYTTSSATDKSMLFEQVRIPLFNKDGVPIDSRRFYRGIIDLLQKTDLQVPAKLISRGLGEVRIVIGQK